MSDVETLPHSQVVPVLPALVYFKASELRFGGEIGIDSRTTGREDNLEDLIASIMANGLLQPIGVWRDPETGFMYCVYGNRRLAAIQAIEERTNFVQQVACLVVEAEREELLSISAAENLPRLPLHPVDQYEAFSAMQKGGMTRERIGERFGLSTLEIDKRLALGNLAPEIRKAWRDGEIREDSAKAFAAAQDREAQAALFKTIFESHRHWMLANPRAIREELLGDSKDRVIGLKFAGKEYAARGGLINEDLFGEDQLPVDPALLRECILEKGRAIAAKELKKGKWAWVEFERDLDDNWSWTLPRYKRFDDEFVVPIAERGEWGAVITLLENGKTAIVQGVKRAPDTPARVADIDATDTAPTPRRTKEKGAEPAATLAVARVALTVGLSKAIAEDPTAAKVALCVALVLSGRNAGSNSGTAVCITTKGASVPEEGMVDLGETPAEVAAQISSMSPGALDRLLARLVAGAIDARSEARVGGAWNSKAVTPAGVEVVANLVDVDRLTRTISESLDYGAYFDGAPKEIALSAIKALGGDEGAWAKKKKADIAAEATRLCAAGGSGEAWIPASIRWGGYMLPDVAPLE